jgi:hypothetical protein
MSSIDPYTLDWGNFTPDGYDTKKKEAIYAFNFDISSQPNIERSKIFAVGKIIWAYSHIPKDSQQKIVFDFRGQPLALLDRARRIKEDIEQRIHDANPSINIVIEILI